MKMKHEQLNISGEKWLSDPDLLRLMELLNADGENARIVGGAVRDALLCIYWKRKKKIGDIDIASKLTPDENIQLLEKAGIKVIPTGVKYGTVTAVLNKKAYEITTLRRDIETDGRHAQVVYTRDWSEDAERRDFTINALYLSIDGTVHDPLGGLKDLKEAKIRFIGNARDRIEEDALRILRFFRFSSNVEVGGIDETGLLACVEQKHLIRKLSGERVWQEFEKILMSKKVMQIIPVLEVVGLLREIVPNYKSYDGFLNYVKLEKKLKLKNPLGRLSCLLPNNEKIVKNAASDLKLSNFEKDRLIKYAADYEKHDLTSKSIRRVLYGYGKDVVIYNLIRRGVLDKKTLYYVNDYTIPIFPIHGQDLLDNGWKAGKEMGAELKRLEQIWIDNDFNPIKTEPLH